MDPSTRRTLRPLDNFTPDRSCFACGRDNPAGLHMDFATDGEKLYSRLVLPETLCGWEGIAHGGIVATVLDEIMSWTAVHLLERLILTRRIGVEYLRPVPTGTVIRVEGWVERIVSDREAVMGASILDNAGGALTRADGIFALFTPAAARKVWVIDPSVIRGFEAFFKVA